MHDLDGDRRRVFLRIDEETKKILRDFKPVLEKEIDGILQRFYAYIGAQPTLKGFFADPAVQRHAQMQQKRHWLESVFAGDFGETYMQRVFLIGQVHERIGLEPRWYMGAYRHTLGEMLQLAAKTHGRHTDRLIATIDAITKAIFLDMDLAISVYLEARQETARKALVNQQADDFDAKVGQMVRGVRSTATALRSTAGVVSSTAETSLDQSAEALRRADQAANNVQTVAAAAEELNASIQEIAHRLGDSTTIIASAVSEAQRTDTLFGSLSEAAEAIGGVVKLINSIASQTNLLALNATIEAARAGEAGKGFAVVAGEVKTLANQTARATEEIATHVKAMQVVSRQAVTAIAGIGRTIGSISEISTAIASAVEEQSAATQNISANMQEASGNTIEVAGLLKKVNGASQQAHTAAADVLKASDHMAADADQLSQHLHDFIEVIRST